MRFELDKKKHGETIAWEDTQSSGEMPLWGLDIIELTGHNLEAHGREEVNRLLQSGWILLHIYTLKYPEDGVWRERPMAILGRPKKRREQPGKESR